MQQGRERYSSPVLVLVLETWSLGGGGGLGSKDFHLYAQMVEHSDCCSGIQTLYELPGTVRPHPLYRIPRYPR